MFRGMRILTGLQPSGKPHVGNDFGARKPAVKRWVEFGGEIGEKRSSAQITRHYTPEGLVGRQVLAVVNFPPRQIGKVMSEVLVLGVPDAEGEVVLIGPGHDVPLGGRLF